MLLNIGGAHNAYFTRILWYSPITPGIPALVKRQAEGDLSDACRCYSDGSGPGSCALNKVVQQVHKGNQAADFDTSVKGPGPLNYALTPWRRWKPLA